MKYLLITLFLFFNLTAEAQIEMPEFSIKGMAYKQMGDSITYVYSTDSMYKQVWRYNRSDRSTYNLYYNGTCTIEGEIHVGHHHNITRIGLWKSFYNNGNIKEEGYYYNDEVIGPWKFYYDDGQLKEHFHYSRIAGSNHWGYDICKTGLYEYYYPNGQVKETGLYQAKLDTNCIDTIMVEDPVSGETQQLIKKGKHFRSSKIGYWYYYNANGALERKQYY